MTRSCKKKNTDLDWDSVPPEIVALPVQCAPMAALIRVSSSNAPADVPQVFSSSNPLLHKRREENLKELLPQTKKDSSLRALVGRADGFGRCAIDSLHGAIYYVTTL